MNSRRKGFSAFFPTPKYLLLSAAGLVITDDEVRLLEFGTSARGALKIARFEKVSLPPNTIQAGFVSDEEALKAGLANIAYAGVRYVHVTLPEERTYLFAATIDRVPEESLPDAVAFILEENVPLPLANAVFDYAVVGEPAPGKIRVAVSVLSKKAVDFYTSLLSSAGLEPISFSLESQATARAIVPEGEKGTILILKLSPEKVGLYVAADGAVQFSTTLPYSAGSRPGDLKAEILKVVAFWNARAAEVGDDKISSALACGSSALDPALAQEILRESGLSISSADPWVNVPLDATKLPREMREEPLAYSATIGAALGASGRLLKLLTEEGKRNIEAEYGRRRWVLVLSALCGILLAGAIGLLPAFVLERVRSSEAREKGNSLSTSQGEESVTLSAWLASEKRKLAGLSPSLDRSAPTPVIDKLLATVPKGIRLSDISWTYGESGGTLALTGTADNRQALVDFENALSSSGDYSDVSLPLSSLAKESDIPFTVKLVPKSLP